MIKVGVRALRNQLSRYLADVRGGETVIVTEHGKPIARIQPVVEERQLPEAVRRLIESGNLIYKDAVDDLGLPTIKLSPGRKTMVDYVREQRR